MGGALGTPKAGGAGLEKDMKSSLMSIYGSLQSDGSSSETFQPKPLTKDMTFLKSIGSFDKIPKWLSEEDFNLNIREDLYRIQIGLCHYGTYEC